MKPIDNKPEFFKLGGKLGLREISKIEQCLIFRQKEFLQNRASESGSKVDVISTQLHQHQQQQQLQDQHQQQQQQHHQQQQQHYQQ